MQTTWPTSDRLFVAEFARVCISELSFKMDRLFQLVVFSAIYPITAFKMMHAERGNTVYERRFAGCLKKISINSVYFENRVQSIEWARRFYCSR